MKSKHRSRWASYHVYLACFFLPLALLYTLTGMLYLLDVHGDNSEEVQLKVPLNQAFPTEQSKAKALLDQHYPVQTYGEIRGEYYDMGTGHSWYSFNQEVMLSASDNTLVIDIHVHGVWKKLVMIHKGHAHIGFWLLGILLSLSLLFSIISGAVLALTNKKYRRVGQVSILSGTLIIIICYFLPL